jgi:uncharacterized membrane protein YebE (DUF533 family)
MMLENIDLITRIGASIAVIAVAIIAYLTYRKSRKKKPSSHLPPDLHNQTPPEPNFVGIETHTERCVYWSFS